MRENYEKAGEIAKKVKKYAKKTTDKDERLFEIAEKIEDKIINLGGKIAFPTNLSINEIAAHSTPEYNSKEKAHGLIKIDLGIHINGYIADTAFSLDLEDSDKNKKLIKASEKALEEAIKIIKPGIEIWKIGGKIQKTITSFNLSPISNLNGHSLGEYEIHSGITIPNTNNNNKNKLEKGFYAVEPFSTPGVGKVYEGKPSGIFMLIEKKPVRRGRKILKFIQEEYKSLPFCKRWIVKKFGRKSALDLKFLEKNNVIKQYSELIEESKKKVAQSEHTIHVDNKTKILT